MLLTYLLRQRRNATTDGNATYDDIVCVIAAVEIDYNVAVFTNVVAITRMPTGCESSHQFLEAQFISSSMDGWTVARRPARWGGWTSALITLSSAVLSLSLLLLPRSPSPRAVCI